MNLTIEKLIYGGDGLAHLPADEHGRGKAVFLPFVLPGEQVEASVVEERPGFVRARAEKILQPSPLRIAPQCPYFQSCGGCHYQHTSYEHQLEIKATVLRENLHRIAKLELEPELKVHPSPPWNYRNRTRLKVQAAPEFAVGYYRLGSHELLPVKECPISSPLINQAIAGFWKMGRASEFAAQIREIEFFANIEDTQFLIEVHCAPETRASEAQQLAHDLQQALPEASGVVVFKTSVENVTAAPNRVAVSGAAELTYTTEHASYRVSAGAFFQVNRHLATELVKIVTEGQSGNIALDLYAGVGLFSTVLARSFAQVIAVEASPISHADLLYNSPGNVKAVQATTEQYLETVPRNLRPELVVVDPPRGGLGERVVRRLAELSAPQLIYVSCDPATLARDLRALLASGYRVQAAHLVDLFPQTYHLESVFHLIR